MAMSHVIVEARKLILDLSERLHRARRYSSPFSEEDKLIMKTIDDVGRWLDEVCIDGGKHEYRSVDDCPYPGVCAVCERALP